MLSFAVFNDDGPAADWPLRHAFLVGPDDSPLQADVRCTDGIIRCEKRTPDAAGLCLQFPVDAVEQSPEGRPAGLLTLQTCLLPERDAPYLLSLELARHRIMLLINKLEDWALFDMPADEPAMELFEAARQAFTSAVVAAGAGRRPGGKLTPEADRLARRALALAVEASELLARTHASVQHARRASGQLTELARQITPPENALTPHETNESRNALIGSVGVILPGAPLIGCAVSPELFTPALQKMVAAGCDFLRMPFRWVDMEPTEGVYAFKTTDRWIEWAVLNAKIPVVGGPVIDFRPRCVPEWLYIWEHDYETLRELVCEHVRNIVTRYRKVVSTWTVVSGLHTNTNFSFSLEQVMDLTRICVLLLRKLQPGATVQVEIDQPWGEAAAQSQRAIAPMLYAEMCAQTGLNVDMFSLRVQVGQPEPGRSTRDLMAFSAMLDRYAALQKPLSVSALSAPSLPPDPESLGLNREFEPGYSRQPWSPEAQANWLTTAVAIAAAKPYVHSVCWDELYDTGKHPAHDGLIAADGQSKPAMRRLIELRQAIKEKRSPLTLEPIVTAPA